MEFIRRVECQLDGVVQDRRIVYFSREIGVLSRPTFERKVIIVSSNGPVAEIVYGVADTKLVGGINNARIGCVARIAELTLNAVTERWIRRAREVDPPNNLDQDPVEVCLMAVHEYLAIR